MEKIKGYAFALGSAVLLGAMAVLIKIVMDMGLSLLGAMFFRFSLSALFLAVFLMCKKISVRINRRQCCILIFVSVVGYGVMNLCYYGAFLYISVGLAGMIHYIYPVIAVLLAKVLYRNKYTKSLYAALVVAVIGAMVLSFSDFGEIDMFGVLLALIAGVCYGTYGAMMEHPDLKNLSGLVVVFYLAFFTAVFTILLSPFFGELPWSSVNFDTFSVMLVIAVFCTVLALFLFRESVVRIGIAKTTILSTMEPVSAAVIGIIFLNETVGLGMLIGSVLILVAVIRITLAKNVMLSDLE